MILTTEQQRWCSDHGLGMGYDDDNQDLVQYAHVVEKTGEKPCTDAPEEMFDVLEALCRSERLWIANVPPSHVWPALMDATPEQNEFWATVTCVHCQRILIERGCPIGDPT